MELIERQLELEKEYTAAGAAEALRKWQEDLATGRLQDTNSGRAITARLYGLLAENLREEFSRTTRGLGARYRRILQDVGIDICAVIAIRSFLAEFGMTRTHNGQSREPIAQDFISTAGNAVEMEWAVAKLRIAAPGYTHRVLENLKHTNTTSENHRRRTFLAASNNVGLSTDEVTLSTAEREGCGRILLEALVQLEVLTLEQLPRGRGQFWYAMRPTEQMERWLSRAADAVRAFNRYPPMLVPPVEHTRETLFSGASYLTAELAAVCGSVKMRSRLSEHREWVRENIAESVLAAANKAAQQPYIIDTETAALLRDLFSQGMHKGICGIPDTQPVTIPDYPLERDWNRDDPELLGRHEAWKVQARQAYAAELERKSHVRDFSQTMRYLREFYGDTLYFPTYFDWRGRLYFRSRINPQGSDVVKSVLQFKNKKPLGKRGLYWLKVHVATCYGFDKKHFDTRAVWTDQNMDLIRECVKHHVDVDFFRAADSPWCFYVAARELVRAIDSGNPEAWETGVPVAMDATCSGMQHFSAMLRDPVGGMFTNLMPNNGDEKEDIYAASAGVTVARLQQDHENPVQSRYWLNSGVPRNLAKRPVMTYVYGGTLQSCTEYVWLDMKERGLERLPEYSEFNLASYLSGHLRKGIEATVPAAAEGMRYLRHLAASMPRDVAIRWVTPAGFPVVQHYAHEVVSRLNLPALGIQLNMTRYDDSQLNRLRCMNGIAPNFVHGLDSSHLVRVLGKFEGSLVPIHDSFGTHPCDVDEMHRVLREEFVRMYTESDPLADLTAAVQQHTHDELVQPTKGSLDIAKVRQSTFFMC